MSKKTTHILFDASPLIHNKTGVGHFTERLLLSIAKQPNIKITAYYFNFFGLKRHVNLPESPNITYRVVRFFPSKIISVLRRMGAQPPVELFVGFSRFDFAIYPNFVALPSVRKVPYAVAIHDMCFKDHPEYTQPLNRRFLERFTEKSARSSQFVITISEFTKSRIEHHFGSEIGQRAIVLPIPYETEDTPGPISQRIKDLARRPFALYVGTIEPRKNVANLVEAFNIDSALQKNSSLVLAGGIGWETEETLDLIEKTKQVADIFQLGYVSAAERDFLYRHSTVVCLISHYEGFGMPILEAMHYKKPLLLSSIPVFKEVAGNSATYCEQNNPIDIAKKLKPFFDKSTKPVPVGATQHYSWSKNGINIMERINTSLKGSL